MELLESANPRASRNPRPNRGSRARTARSAWPRSPAARGETGRWIASASSLLPALCSLLPALRPLPPAAAAITMSACGCPAFSRSAPFTPGGVVMSIRLAGSLSLMLLLGLAWPGIACAAHEAFTDPAKAGPDFAVQGEYVGEGKFDGDMKKVGMQVVALGNHEFDATLFVGGLPGDGWSRGDTDRPGQRPHGRRGHRTGRQGLEGDHQGRRGDHNQQQRRQGSATSRKPNARAERSAPSRPPGPSCSSTARTPTPGRTARSSRAICSGSERPRSSRSAISRCTSNSAAPSCPIRAVRGAAIAAFICKIAMRCRCSIRSAWKGWTTIAAESTKSPRKR